MVDKSYKPSQANPKDITELRRYVTRELKRIAASVNSAVTLGLDDLSDVDLRPTTDPAKKVTQGHGIWFDEVTGTWRNRAGAYESIPTGLVDGGELNIVSNEIEALAGLGVIVDSYTSPQEPPTQVGLQWPRLQEPITVAPAVAGSIVWFSIRNSGVVATPPDVGGVPYFVGELVQYATTPSPTESRQEIFLGIAVHNGVGWGEASNPKVVNQSAETLRELLVSVTGPTTIIQGGAINELPSFQMQQEQGTLWEQNRNWHRDKSNPNRELLPEANPVQFRYTNQDFSTVGPLTPTVTPGLWDNNGTVEAVPGAANACTIQRLYLDIADNYWVLYGQEVYDNFTVAVANLYADNPTVPFLLQNSILIGFIVAEKAKSDWNVDEAIFIPFETGATIAGAGTPITFHDDLSGITPDNHHNQVHLLYGTDHSDILQDGGPVARDVLGFQDPSQGLGTQWQRSKRMNWLVGGWVNGKTYYESDVINDEGWLAYANITTTERPAPVPIADPLYPISNAPWTLTNFQLNNNNQGQRYVMAQEAYVNGIYAYVNPDNLNLPHTIAITVNGTVRSSLAFVPTQSGFQGFDTTASLLFPGDVVEVIIRVNNTTGNLRCYYTESPDWWLTNTPALFTSIFGLLEGVQNDNAYGVDLVFVEADISPDWDIIAAPPSSGGSGGAPPDVTWGEIVGLISDQTDLQAELDAKANLSGATFTGNISAPNTDAHIADVDLHYSDAPVDGQRYSRVNNTWAVSPGEGGGNVAPGANEGEFLYWNVTADEWLPTIALLRDASNNIQVAGQMSFGAAPTGSAKLRIKQAGGGLGDGIQVISSGSDTYGAYMSGAFAEYAASFGSTAPNTDPNQGAALRMGDFGFGWSLWVGDGAGAQTRTMWATRSGSVNIDTSLNINGPVYVSLDGAAASSAYRNAFFGSAVANVAPDVIIQDADSSVDRSALEILGGGGTIDIAKFRSNGQTELSGPVTIGSDTQVIGRLSARDRFELYSTNGSEVVLQIQADADDVWMKSPSDLLTIYDIGNKHWIDWDGVNGVSIAFNFNTVFASTANGPELRNGAINILRPADANGNMLMWGKLYTNQDTVETVGLQVKCGEAASAWTRIANFTNSAATIIGGIDIQQGQVPRFSSGSDVRLKENIVDVDQDQYLTKLNAIRIREFDIFENFFKEKKLGRCVGVVAQEYIEVDPGSVMIDPADPFEVQYVGSRDWELIAAVQALSAQVAELKQRLGDEI